jgi:hypothetical protein
MFIQISELCSCIALYTYLGGVAGVIHNDRKAVRANLIATARPIPLEAPVTMTLLLYASPISCSAYTFFTERKKENMTSS